MKINNSAPNSRKSKQGFTLTEMVIASTISLMLLASAYKLFSHVQSQMRTTAARTEATNNIRTAIDYLRALGFDSTELDAPEPDVDPPPFSAQKNLSIDVDGDGQSDIEIDYIIQHQAYAGGAKVDGSYRPFKVVITYIKFQNYLTQQEQTMPIAFAVSK